MPVEREYGGFTVDLESFSGPLDLLLSLIRREEIDIFDIPIARITDQYVGALDQMREDRIEVAGEFMVVAATLMQIKSKMLLPRPQPAADEEDEEDPRRELVELLLEYQQYKEAAELLEGLAEARQRLYEVPGEPVDTGPAELLDATVAGLFRSYERLLHGVSTPEPPLLYEPHHTVGEQCDVILARLALGPVTFEGLFSSPPTSRVEIVVTFMALLELILFGEVKAEQDEVFGEILIHRVDTRRPATTEPE